MDMLEHSLTTDEAMTFTIDNGVPQSADGSLSLIWPLQLPSGQLLEVEEEEDEAAEFFQRASDDAGQDADDADADADADLAYQFDPELTVVVLNILAQHWEVDFETVVHRLVYGEEAYGDGVVPASGAAVAGLEKQAFHATPEGCECGCGVTGCAICLEDFEDGEEVVVMPCSGGHEFHPGCITEWLGQKNTCPLCRHALPTDVGPKFQRFALIVCPSMVASYILLT